MTSVLIVGSGLAGLSFGALMAQSGRQVKVLDAHYHPGGYGHSFEFGKPARKFKYNAQFHYVWNCGEGRTVNRFLRRLGLEAEVSFESYDKQGFDRMRMPGYAVDIPGDWEELHARLARLFPEASKRIRAFLSETRALADELDNLPGLISPLRMLLRYFRFRRVIKWRKATLQQVFDHFKLPPAAQTLLGLQWPDFLEPPAELSFFAWTMLFAGYMRGAYYPTHHFEHVIDSLVKVIEDHGGEVCLRRRVSGFLREGTRILGAVAEVVDDGCAPTGESEEYRADMTVCNMDPQRAAQMIGLEHFSKDVRRCLEYEYSASNFMAYLAVEGLDLREHGFGKSNLFHTEEPDLNRAFEAMYKRGDYQKISFAMCVPSLLTPMAGDRPEGTQLVELLTVAEYGSFQQLRGESRAEYNRKKRAILDKMLDVVERDYVPGFRDALCFKITGSPTTNERYCLSPRGNSYGSRLIPRYIGPGRLTHHSSLQGLHFCNASAGFPGFAGTVWTGCNLYEHLTGDHFLRGPLPGRLVPKPAVRSV